MSEIDAIITIAKTTISGGDDIAGFFPKLAVIGVGGGGGNAVDNMIAAGVDGVEFIAANTDLQSLKNSSAPLKIQLGASTTRGFGAGSRPDVGESAARESINDVADAIDGAQILFIVGGLGGGTGSGAMPVIAQMARDKGILTCAVATTPFDWEGSQKAKIAEAALSKLEASVDCLISLSNQNLFKVVDSGASFKEAFRTADGVMLEAVKNIADLIMKPGLINRDFADIRTIMENRGRSIIGIATETGEHRAIRAVEKALANPLFGGETIKGATALLVNITGGPEGPTLDEVQDAMNAIRTNVGGGALVIDGIYCDDDLDDAVKVAIIATGLPGGRREASQKPDAGRGFEPEWEPAAEEPLQAPPAEPEEPEAAEAAPAEAGAGSSPLDIWKIIQQEEEELLRRKTAESAERAAAPRPAERAVPKKPDVEPEPPPPAGGKKKNPLASFLDMLSSGGDDTFFSGSADADKMSDGSTRTTGADADNIIFINNKPGGKKLDTKQIDLVDLINQTSGAEGSAAYDLPKILKE